MIDGFYRDRYGILQAGRYKAIKADVPLLLKLLKQAGEDDYFAITENGLPEDARIIRTTLDWTGFCQTLFIVAESQEWPVVTEAEPIPLLSPTVSMARKGGKKAPKRGRGGDKRAKNTGNDTEDEIPAEPENEDDDLVI